MVSLTGFGWVGRPCLPYLEACINYIGQLQVAQIIMNNTQYGDGIMAPYHTVHCRQVCTAVTTCPHL